MSATERLYYSDSRLLEFDARVLGLNELGNGLIAVTLDRTAFYPTGGGQPNDTGRLGDARVVDCVEEGIGVLHLIEGPTPAVGDMIHCKVDRLRRLDHIQQHSGQHILSAAFVKLFDAPTRSFRVLEHECEIDVDLNDPTDEKIEQAVDLANQIIWENRAVQIRQVTSQEASSLQLRKEPARDGDLRLIEITDFDLTPCGGTHAKSTGEVGMIAVTSWVRAKGLARIQFMAGIRVLADYRKANRTARAIAAIFSAGRDDSPALVAKLIEDNKKLARRVRELEEIAGRVEADELLKQARVRIPTSRDSDRSIDPIEEAGSIETRVIARVFDDRDADSLKQLALALIAHPNVVALLGSREAGTARLVFARSSDAPGDMNALMRKACEMIDGRGGGKSDMAQGGGKSIGKVADVIYEAVKSLV